MLSRTTLLAATVLAAAAALVGVGSTTAQAATEVHIYQYVQAHHSGKDLAVLNASTAPGQPIVQFTRNTGPNQQWEITSLPSSPAPGMAPDRQIKNRLSGLCLDVANNSLAAQRSCRTRATSTTRRSAGSCPSWPRSSARMVASVTT